MTNSNSNDGWLSNERNDRGFMAWLPIEDDPATEKVLHVKSQGRWIPYFAMPNAVSDYEMTPPLKHGRASRGFAIMQCLLKKGYRLVPTEEAMRQKARLLDCWEINEWG